MAINSFSDVDLRTLPAAIIQARITAVQAAITTRLAGATPETAESYAINGKQERRTPLEFLMMYEAALYRALAVQGAEPKGIGLLDVSFPNSGDCGSIYGRQGYYN